MSSFNDLNLKRVIGPTRRFTASDLTSFAESEDRAEKLRERFAKEKRDKEKKQAKAAKNRRRKFERELAKLGEEEE